MFNFITSWKQFHELTKFSFEETARLHPDNTITIQWARRNISYRKKEKYQLHFLLCYLLLSREGVVLLGMTYWLSLSSPDTFATIY